jgi:hypothetical protein
MEEHEILAELGEIMDSLPRVPQEAFAERSALLGRQAELRSLLAEAQEAAGRDASMWAEQAARKKSDDPKPYIEIHLPDSSASGG